MGATEKSVIDAIQVLVIAMCAGIILMIFVRIEETTARRVYLEANACYDQGKRATLIHGEIKCRDQTGQ